MSIFNSSLHLRLANMRRFLDKYLPNGGDFNDDALYNRCLNMVRDWSLPICIRVDSQNEYEAVLIEKLLFDDINNYDKENTKDFYVLGCGFKTENACREWINKRFNYYIPWVMGHYNAAYKIA